MHLFMILSYALVHDYFPVDGLLMLQDNQPSSDARMDILVQPAAMQQVHVHRILNEDELLLLGCFEASNRHLLTFSHLQSNCALWIFAPVD